MDESVATELQRPEHNGSSLEFATVVGQRSPPYLYLSGPVIVVEMFSTAQTIADRSSFSRNCYLLRSQQQNAGHSVHSISELSNQRRDQILSGAIARAQAMKDRTIAILDRVRQWNPEIADHFELKQVPFSMSPLRVLNSTWEMIEKPTPETVEPIFRSSFVAQLLLAY